MSSPRGTVPEAASSLLHFDAPPDPHILEDYLRLCSIECRASNAPADIARERAQNRDSLFLTVRQGERCIGGARLTLRRARHDAPLPMETDGFALHRHFPALQEQDRIYCELSRLVLTPAFRNGAVTRQILSHLYDLAAQNGISTMFAAAPLENARLYKKLARAMGLSRAQIHDDIDVPRCPPGSTIRDVLLRIELVRDPR